jgi:hypothetical protein
MIPILALFNLVCVIVCFVIAVIQATKGNHNKALFATVVCLFNLILLVNDCNIVIHQKPTLGFLDENPDQIHISKSYS